MEIPATIYFTDNNFDLNSYLQEQKNLTVEVDNGTYLVSTSEFQVKITPKSKSTDDSWWQDHISGFKDFVTAKLTSDDVLKEKILNYLDKISRSFGIVSSVTTQESQDRVIEFISYLAQDVNGVIFVREGLFDACFYPLVTKGGETDKTAKLPG